MFGAEYMDSSFGTPPEILAELQIAVRVSVPHPFSMQAVGSGANRNGWNPEVVQTPADQPIQQS